MSWMSISVVNARKNLNAAALAQLRSFVRYSSQGVSNSKRLSGFKTQNINNQNCELVSLLPEENSYLAARFSAFFILGNFLEKNFTIYKNLNLILII